MQYNHWKGKLISSSNGTYIITENGDVIIIK